MIPILVMFDEDGELRIHYRAGNNDAIDGLTLLLLSRGLRSGRLSRDTVVAEAESLTELIDEGLIQVR